MNHKRTLPVLSLVGYEFYFDEKNDVLIECKNPYNKIYKNNFLYSYITGERGIYFDTKRKLALLAHELQAAFAQQRNKGCQEVLPSSIHFISEASILQKIDRLKVADPLNKPQKKIGKHKL